MSEIIRLYIQFYRVYKLESTKYVQVQFCRLDVNTYFLQCTSCSTPRSMLSVFPYGHAPRLLKSLWWRAVMRPPRNRIWDQRVASMRGGDNECPSHRFPVGRQEYHVPPLDVYSYRWVHVGLFYYNSGRLQVRLQSVLLMISLMYLYLYDNANIAPSKRCELQQPYVKIGSEALECFVHSA